MNTRTEKRSLYTSDMEETYTHTRENTRNEEEAYESIVERAGLDMAAHFGSAALMKYALPSVAMMVFTSLYGIVDGFFVSNYAGSEAFAAVTLIMPFIMILSAIGFMVGSGGSALISRTRGQGKERTAQEYFSLIIYATIILGVALSALGAIAMEPLAYWLGARGQMLEYAVLYGRISMVSLTCYMLQSAFQMLFSTAGKPHYGLRVILAAGITNMVLDFLFVGLWGWGVAGAAWATVTSEFVGGLVPLVYFARPNGSSLLHLGKPSRQWSILGTVAFNGSSEMMSTIAMSIVAMVFNWQILRMMGTTGVAAYGIIIYAGMIFSAIFAGYCMGVAPLMSFQHGRGDGGEKRSQMRSSLLIVLITGILMAILAQVTSPVISWIFASYDGDLQALVRHGMSIYGWCFAFMGIVMYISSLFTALGNGLISALIAILRTLVCEIGCVLGLPLVFGNDGIWLSIVVAEAAAMLIAIAFLLLFARRYDLR